MKSHRTVIHPLLRPWGGGDSQRRYVPPGHSRGGRDATIRVDRWLSLHPWWCCTQRFMSPARWVPCKPWYFPHSFRCSQTLSPWRRAEVAREKEPSRGIFHHLTKWIVASSLGGEWCFYHVLETLLMNLTHVLLEGTHVACPCLFLTLRQQYGGSRVCQLQWD